MFMVWVQKNRMDPTQHRLAVVQHDPPFIQTRIKCFQVFGNQLGHKYSDKSNVVYFLLASTIPNKDAQTIAFCLLLCIWYQGD